MKIVAIVEHYQQVSYEGHSQKVLISKVFDGNETLDEVCKYFRNKFPNERLNIVLCEG